MSHEVRYKLTATEYLYLQGLARFFYDNRVIPTSTVHSLGKLAIRKIANEWIDVQTIALQKRKKKVIAPLFTNDSNSALSVDAAPPSQTTASNKKVKPKKTISTGSRARMQKPLSILIPYEESERQSDVSKS